MYLSFFPYYYFNFLNCNKLQKPESKQKYNIKIQTLQIFWKCIYFKTRKTNRIIGISKSKCSNSWKKKYLTTFRKKTQIVFHSKKNVALCLFFLFLKCVLSIIALLLIFILHCCFYDLYFALILHHQNQLKKRRRRQ